MNIPLLYKEKTFTNHQFPTVTALNDPPTLYEGMLRCEKGEVKTLAEKTVWPFTEYADWNRFRLELSDEYPLKPPRAMWLTDISHPNIVPKIMNAVCVSILGENWRPDLKLVSVVNALYYLLSDPNPDNVFDHPSCLKAASVCRQHGFPKMTKRKATGQQSDVLRFNIVPIPQAPRQSAPPGDVIRFRIPERERKER
ncbi:MAG: ubiquitin-conjugating enzyme E2 [Candidatus Bathyarchaeia archaeon]